MKNLEYTYYVYKNYVNPVWEFCKDEPAGFFNLKITTEEVIDSLFGGHASLFVMDNVSTTLFESCKNSKNDGRTVEESELVANSKEGNLVQKSEKACHLFDGLFLFRNITNKIKGRVERDCLNVSENKTEILSNTYSAKALCWAPTSEDNRCMMRVIKETGIEKCGRPENEGRPIKVRNNDSKLTLKFNLFHLFTNFHL